MYFHVMVGANDLDASRRFYDATLGALGIPSMGAFRENAWAYGNPQTGLFLLTDGGEAHHANGGTIMFRAKNREEVDNFYHQGMANGGTECTGAPHPGGLPKSYVAHIRDPIGNKLGVISFDQ